MGVKIIQKGVMNRMAYRNALFKYKKMKLDWTNEARTEIYRKLNSIESGSVDDPSIELTESFEFQYYENSVHELPTGSYEADDIISFLKEKEPTIHISIVKNTGKCSITIENDKTFVDFTKDNSIRSILGFDSGILKPNNRYIGDYPVNITDINTIRIDCNIATGSYLNCESSHNIHEFYPNVAPGFKIVEVPKNLIYLPVVGRIIHTVRVNITDQKGKVIDFRGETITCRIHIKKEQ